jgi:hypothetical protein
MNKMHVAKLTIMPTVFSIVAALYPNRLHTESMQRKVIQDTKMPAVDASQGKLKIDLLARRFIAITDAMKIAVTNPGIARSASFVCSKISCIVTPSC